MRLHLTTLAPAFVCLFAASARAQQLPFDPMARMGSGTSWMPEAVPLPEHSIARNGWQLMLHEFATAQFDQQSGPRGDSQWGSINWAMGMASRPLANGTLTLRAMASLDVLGVSGRGYPLLLQSGEAYHGQPVHDRQHPHDALMELSAMYDHAVSGADLEIYVAPVGEPALGPPAFMHRPSAMDIATAPIGHHWQDATHISYGVVTAGLAWAQWKFEGSAFNGREPDDDRWNIDPIRLDSYAGRVSFAPGAAWTASASYGYLASPEALRPDVSQHRITTSLMRSVALRRGGFWATTAVWGANATSGESRLSNSLLLESELGLDGGSAVYGRAEFVQKTAEDLVVNGVLPGGPSQVVPVSALSLGGVRELGRAGRVTIGAGLTATLDYVPAALESTYGSRTPAGLIVYFRVRPATGAAMAMSMDGMGPMDEPPGTSREQRR